VRLVSAKLKGMTATQTRRASRLSPLVDGICTAVDSHAGRAETAQVVADQLRRHPSRASSTRSSSTPTAT
jgi:hypothetical protein